MRAISVSENRASASSGVIVSSGSRPAISNGRRTFSITVNAGKSDGDWKANPICSRLSRRKKFISRPKSGNRIGGDKSPTGEDRLYDLKSMGDPVNAAQQSLFVHAGGSAQPPIQTQSPARGAVRRSRSKKERCPVAAGHGPCGRRHVPTSAHERPRRKRNTASAGSRTPRPGVSSCVAGVHDGPHRGGAGLIPSSLSD